MATIHRVSHGYTYVEHNAVSKGIVKKNTVRRTNKRVVAMYEQRKFI